MDFDAAGPTRWVEYDYDASGRLAAITYPEPYRGSITYSYDGFGRKRQVADGRHSDDNIGGSGVIQYEYDPLNQLIGMVDQDGYATGYSYRADGRKQAITVTEPTTGAPLYEVDLL